MDRAHLIEMLLQQAETLRKAHVARTRCRVGETAPAHGAVSVCATVTIVARAHPTLVVSTNLREEMARSAISLLKGIGVDAPHQPKT